MFTVSSERGPNFLLKQPSLSECTDALEEKKFFPEKKMQRLHFPLLAALLLSAPPGVFKKKKKLLPNKFHLRIDVHCI